MESASLIDRLRAHRTLASVPREQLAWLASVGVEKTIEPGEVLTPSIGPFRAFYVVLDGYLLIRVDRGAGPRIVMEWHAGDVTGILPYSRIKAPPGDVVAEERTTILSVDPSHLAHMIRECPELTAVLPPLPVTTQLYGVVGSVEPPTPVRVQPSWVDSFTV